MVRLYLLQAVLVTASSVVATSQGSHGGGVRTAAGTSAGSVPRVDVDAGDVSLEGIVSPEKKDFIATFLEEKSAKCEGQSKKGNKGKTCEGGAKSEFNIGFGAEDIAQVLANQLYEQTSNFWPTQDGFLPDDETMESLVDWDDEAFAEGVEEGVTKEIKFGGFVKVDFDCKVSFGREDGKFTKKSACGFKANSEVTKNPQEFTSSTEDAQYY
eukprot:Nitzschia sp. Nitz4//scaffold1_size375055//290609//291244//NITZ4_000314-RA/size375055-processed-gene-0.458-mRNA-1//-1//CDS//3329541159//504//frame0